MNNEIHINHITKRYVDVEALRDLSLEIGSGELFGLIGPDGAGKTTLVNLLMRFYETDDGRIEVERQDITEVTRDSLRRSFGMVLQDTWLFKGTIMENILSLIHI